jgi:alkyldihydroxyacetonephosphate synthase
MTTEMHPQRWGDPAAAVALPESARGLVELAFGDVRETPATDRDLPELPSLDEYLLDALRAVVGAEHVLTDTATRALRTRGKSTPDLLRARAGDLTDAPDVVVRPASQAEVEARRSPAVWSRAARGSPAWSASTWSASTVWSPSTPSR